MTPEVDLRVLGISPGRSRGAVAYTSGPPTPRPPLDAAVGCLARAPRLPAGSAPRSGSGSGVGARTPPLMRLRRRAQASPR